MTQAEKNAAVTEQDTKTESQKLLERREVVTGGKNAFYEEIDKPSPGWNPLIEELERMKPREIVKILQCGKEKDRILTKFVANTRMILPAYKEQLFREARKILLDKLARAMEGEDNTSSGRLIFPIACAPVSKESEKLNIGRNLELVYLDWDRWACTLTCSANGIGMTEVLEKEEAVLLYKESLSDEFDSTPFGCK